MQSASRDHDTRAGVFFGVAGLIILVAAMFRFWDLSAVPLWMDEAFTVLAGRLPLRDVLLDAIDNHPPLGYAVQALWTDVAPALALARVPAAVAGTATILVVIAAMSDLVSRGAALWAGALLAVMPGHIWFSQDARMYPLLVLGLAIATWGVLGGQDPGRHSRLFYFGIYLVGSLVAIYSHFVALVYLTAINVPTLGVFIATRATRTFTHWLIANLILLVLSIPWLLQLLSSVGSFPGLGVTEWSARIVAFFIRNAIGFPVFEGPLGVAAFGLLLAFACAGVFIAWRTKHAGFAAVLAISVPLYVALILALNAKTPLLATRVFLPLVVPVVMLVGTALGAGVYRLALAVLGGLLLASAASASIMEHGERTKHDNPGMALTAAIQAGFRDAPVLTCDFLNAGAYYVAVEAMKLSPLPVLAFFDDQPVRFDEKLFGAVRMSMTKFRDIHAAELNASVGGGHIYEGGLVEALRGRNRAILISEPCGDHEAFAQRVTPLLEVAGFKAVSRQDFATQGRPVMERGETEMMLFERDR